MVFAQTIVEAPKNGAISLAAAISAPRVDTPTVNTIARSRRTLVRSASTAATLEYGRFGSAQPDGAARAPSPGARCPAPRHARLLSRAGAVGPRAHRPRPVAVPPAVLPALR